MRCQQNLAEPISTFGSERVWLAVLKLIEPNENGKYEME
jgi:hypothetical protein